MKSLKTIANRFGFDFDKLLALAESMPVISIIQSGPVHFVSGEDANELIGAYKAKYMTNVA